MNYSDEMKEVLMHYRKKGLSFELAIQSFEESINQFMPIEKDNSVDTDKKDNFGPYKELLNIYTGSSKYLLPSPKDRAIEAYSYLRENSKYNKELCRECMHMLKGHNQLHYLLEMEGLSMYERSAIDEILNFYHVITSEDNKKEVINNYIKFTGLNINQYEIIEVDFNDILMLNENYDYFNTKKIMRSNLRFKDIEDIYELVITGRKYKKLLYIKCRDIRDCNINNHYCNMILNNCLLITKNDVCTYSEYQNNLQ
jgi:hypothetical protein